MRTVPRLALAALLSAAPAAAEPVVHYNWTRCEPWTRNQDDEGPGVYTQTLAVTGLEAGSRRLWFFATVNVGPATYDWWLFPEGCPAAEPITAASGVEGCDALPGLTVTQVRMSLPADGGVANLEVECALDPTFVPDPGRRYGLATIRFDRTRTAIECFGGSGPLCFLAEAALFETAGVLALAALAHDRLTWNDPSDDPDCRPRMPTLPARATSWGRVKTLYR